MPPSSLQQLSPTPSLNRFPRFVDQPIPSLPLLSEYTRSILFSFLLSGNKKLLAMASACSPGEFSAICNTTEAAGTLVTDTEMPSIAGEAP
jgi:hypothetical protein